MAARSVTEDRGVSIAILVCGIEGRVRIKALANAMGTYPYRVLQAVQNWNDGGVGWPIVVEQDAWLRRATQEEYLATARLAQGLDEWGTEEGGES